MVMNYLTHPIQNMIKNDFNLFKNVAIIKQKHQNVCTVM